jgi:hypothetical protein
MPSSVSKKWKLDKNNIYRIMSRMLSNIIIESYFASRIVTFYILSRIVCLLMIKRLTKKRVKIMLSSGQIQLKQVLSPAIQKLC